MNNKISIAFLFSLGFFCSSSFAQFGIDAARERTRDRVLQAEIQPELNQEQSSVTSIRVSEQSDLVYGNNERHRLDIYLPDTEVKPESGFTTLIFLHGGGFTRGDKAEGTNLSKFLADQGIAAISANYRLAPGYQWSNGAEDVASVIQWVHRNSQTYGLNAGRIFLMGHSAGADVIASYVFFEDHQLYDDGVVGAILSSGGSYQLDLALNTEGTELLSEGDSQYFGSDVSRYHSMSSVNALEGRILPLLISYAEEDPASIQQQNLALIEALYQRDQRLPTVIQGIGHNHHSVLSHIELGSRSPISEQLLSFIQSN